jgi:small redox-active disulfide protein 2
MSLKLEILGTGCKKCQQLEANVKTAIETLNLEADINHVTDSVEIAMRGVMTTPALAVNGKVVSKGKVLTAEQVEKFL